MQDSNTELMIYSVRKLIAHCSAATTLDPGDVILTGTPAGVALGRDPAPWLQPGQLCEIDIEGIGRLANRIAGA
jgi:2-keto-4-pentenoate hydratase/2-oxohepta-3-ene-1,7-dioic acid hydratase in catechol pathway